MTDTPNTFAAGFVAGRDAAGEVARSYDNWDYVRSLHSNPEPASPYDRGKEKAAEEIATAISALTPPADHIADAGKMVLPTASAGLNELRSALIAAGRAAGAFLADDVSTEFLLLVPGEIEAKIAALSASLARVERLEHLMGRLCDAYELLCRDTGKNYCDSAGSVYAHCRTALEANDAGIGEGVGK